MILGKPLRKKFQAESGRDERPRLIHNPHAAAAQLFQNAVMGDGSPGHEKETAISRFHLRVRLPASQRALNRPCFRGEPVKLSDHEVLAAASYLFFIHAFLASPKISFVLPAGASPAVDRWRTRFSPFERNSPMRCRATCSRMRSARQQREAARAAVVTARASAHHSRAFQAVDHSTAL